MSKFKNRLLTLLILVFFLAIVFQTSKIVRNKIWVNKGMLETVILPDEEILKRVCLGYTNLAADLIWIRTIRYIFVHSKGDKLFPELSRFFNLIISLDHNFEDIYRIGGEAIRELANEPEASVGFLKEGRLIFPSNWQIAYELGRSYSALNLWDLATESFEASLKMPDAPEWIAVLVAEGYYRQRNYKKSLYWWYQISNTANSKEVLIKSRSKVLFLVSVVGANEIANACSQYYKKFHSIPEEPEKLVEKGFLKKIPDEPLGGKFIIDKKNFTVDSNYIHFLLMRCVNDLNARIEKYFKKTGKYPETLDDLKIDPELGKNFPGNPYDGDYIFDQRKHKVSSSIDYLAKIKIE